MPQLTESRWHLLSASSETECFTVFDRLARKNRTYYVPYLDHVEVSDCMAHVYTSNTKIMPCVSRFTGKALVIDR